jgi:L-lactate dehydrogenase complex protein LldG
VNSQTHTGNEARNEIMQSIRSHLAASPSVASHQAPPPAATDDVPGVENINRSPVEAFCARLESVGGHCIIARDEDESAGTLSSVIGDLQTKGAGKRVALSDAALVLALAQRISAEEITVGPATSDLFNYDVGVTTAQAGIAETGTLILEAEKERHRLVSLLPPVHIAIVRARDIHLTIGDALTSLHGGDQNQLSRAITFITGPSRTADIELTLTVGVHGPKELYVIIIDESQ